MKSKIFKIAFVALFGTGIGYNVFLSANSEKVIADMLIENIEALAGNEYDKSIWERYYRPEGDGYNCIKGGHETC